MQQTIIKHLDRFMEALLSDKTPCHYISTAVMMNMVSRVFGFFVGELFSLHAPPTLGCICEVISQSANLYLVVQSCLSAPSSTEIKKSAELISL